MLDTFEAWSLSRPDGLAEPFLADVLAGNVQQAPSTGDATLFDEQGGALLPWRWAVETVMLRLARPEVVDPDDPRRRQAVLYPRRHVSGLRYYGKLTSPANSGRHTAFVGDLLRRYRLNGVVTTNYDTLVERVLRHRRMVRSPEPGFRYGGLPTPQYAHGHSPWDWRDRTLSGPPGKVELTGKLPLCKLHGSLNWETVGPGIEIFRDQRAVYRRGGTAAIIPPTPEKRPEEWLAPVWNAAADVLARSEEWIVVGYSLPHYDYAVQNLLREAARGGTARSIALHDPNAAERAAHWRDVTGLPVAVRDGL